MILFRGVAMAGQSAEVLTAVEAADYLRVSLKTIYRLASAGTVPGQKVGHSWRFRQADLVLFLQGQS
ncbi:MAG: helix-turn-helix domain-containing protein [Sporichthyaceae bacterium]